MENTYLHELLLQNVKRYTKQLVLLVDDQLVDALIGGYENTRALRILPRIHIHQSTQASTSRTS